MQPGHTRCTTTKRSTTAPSAQPTDLRTSRKNNPRSPGNVPRLSRQKSHASRALRNRRAAKPANTPHTIARTIMSLNVPASGAKSKDPKIAIVSAAVYTQGWLRGPLTWSDYTARFDVTISVHIPSPSRVVGGPEIPTDRPGSVGRMVTIRPPSPSPCLLTVESFYLPIRCQGVWGGIR